MGKTTFRIQSKIFEIFYKAVLETESVPIIMFFPGKDDISREQDGGLTTYYPFIEFLNMHSISYIDCIEAFLVLPSDLIREF